MMQIKYAIFRIVWNKQEYQVAFQDGIVQVANSDLKAVKYENGNSKWKPCVTHAEELVRLAFGGKPKTNVAKRRTILAKPALRVVG